MPIVLGALVALALPAVSAADTKSVSETSKTASITGTISDPGATGLYDLVMFFNGGTEVRGNSACVDPVCQEHTIKVGPNGAELDIDATSDAYNLSLEIIDPTGKRTSVNEVEATTEHSLDFDATPGDWKIRVYGSGDGDTFDYDLEATFKTQADLDAEQPGADPQPAG